MMLVRGQNWMSATWTDPLEKRKFRYTKRRQRHGVFSRSNWYANTDGLPPAVSWN